MTDTDSRAPLTERISASLSNAATEHRANAVAGTNKQGRRTAKPAANAKTVVGVALVTFVAVFMVWSVLGAAGVWDSINATVASVVEGDSNSSDFDVTNYLGTGRVLGFTLLVSIIDVILLTAIATLTAFLYNMAAALLGGIEVTLAEDER